MQTVLTVVVFIIVGGVGATLLLFVLINLDYNRRQDRAQEMDAQYGIAQVWRANAKTRLLYQIGAPECPDGTYSPNQMALWARYNQMDQQDRAETAWERDQIVEMRGYS